MKNTLTFPKRFAKLYATPRSFFQHSELIWQLTKREILGRYKGTVGGLLWSFLHPLIMLSIYTFVFSVVFQARWGLGGGNRLDFALILFAGLIPYQLFAECVNKAPALILNNVNYVKKIVFPLNILPIVQLYAALFHMVISFFILILFWGVLHFEFNWTMIFLPLVNLPLMLICLGAMWFLSSLAVYFRDIVQATQMITLAFLFLSPVFYPASMLPEPYRSIIQLNPLTAILEQNREILLWGHVPDWSQLLVSLAIGLLVAAIGLYWFDETSSGFADVL